MRTTLEGVPAPASTLGSMLAGQKVLIVEEEYLIADSNRTMVLREGGRVLGPFATAYSAFEASMVTPPTVALLDLNLEGFPCFRLADALVSMGVPVVFLTGYEPGLAPARHAGAIWITKPAGTGEILGALMTAAV